MIVSAMKIGDRLPNAGERKAANQLCSILATQAGDHDQKIRVILERGESAEVILTPALSDLLIDVFRCIAKGDAITLVPVSRMLTTQQAADILNVSRPFPISLLDSESIPYAKVGRHRRIKAEDLLNYKQRRDKEREEALSQLAELDANLL